VGTAAIVKGRRQQQQQPLLASAGSYHESSFSSLVVPLHLVRPKKDNLSSNIQGRDDLLLRFAYFKMCTETARIKSTPELNHLRIYALLFCCCCCCVDTKHTLHTRASRPCTQRCFSLSLYPLITNMCLFSSHDHPGTSITHASSLLLSVSRALQQQQHSRNVCHVYLYTRVPFLYLLGAGTGSQLCRYCLVLMARFNNNSLMMAE